MWDRVFTMTLLVAMLIGCSSESSNSSADPVRQLRLVGRYYGSYLSGNQGMPPSKESELREFLKGSVSDLESQGFSGIDQFLVSPRDGKDLVVLYGNEIVEDGPGGLPWVAYEQTGIDGKRYAIGARGTVRELGPSEFSTIFGN